MNLLVTGGAGFIGSNFIQYLLAVSPEHKIVNVDLLTYAGNLENLKDVESHPNYSFVKADIADVERIDSVLSSQKIDAIVNFAAESHVDRSIMGAAEFIRTNVVGTSVLLDAALRHGVPRFVQISTDEVYGSLGATGKFTEQTPLSPNSPYSASKASADMLAFAYHHTHGLDVVITRCSNNYGPYQFPEKLIPLMISNALEGKPLPVYGDGQNVRDWIHVTDHCEAIRIVLEKGKPGDVYNIGGDSEVKNIEVVKTILDILGKPHSYIQFVKDRPGHDRRYAIDFSKISNELGWKPRKTFAEGLKETIDWYVAHKDWWTRIKSGEYQKYYDEWYHKR